MKFVIDNNKFIVFLNKKFDLDDKLKLEKYFKDLFYNLKNKYNMEVNGYYNINVYADKYYGTIIEMENEDLEYYTYFNQIDMEINVFKNNFYYEIDYNFLNKDILNKCLCYKYNDIIKDISKKCPKFFEWEGEHNIPIIFTPIRFNHSKYWVNNAINKYTHNYTVKQQ